MYHNNIIKKVTLILTVLVATTFGQLLFEENFSYTANDPLTNHGWTAHSGAGTNPIRVYTSGLTYAGYAGSGIGNAAKVDTAGEDDNKTFTQQTSGTVYTAFLMNIQKATTTGDYFLHLSTSPLNTYDFVSRLHIKRDASNNVALGLGKRQSDTTFTTFSGVLNTTYLVVLKYEIIAGDSNDRLSLFGSTSGVPSTEPTTPLIGPITPLSSDPVGIGSIALRQGTAAQAPRVIIDGIRIGTSWSGAVAGIEENGLPFSSHRLTLAISPNPFTNFTNISFNVEPISLRGIKIFDATGKVVKTLNYSHGSTIVWDGQNSNGTLVSSGVYFVVAENKNNENQVAKILLSR